MNKKTLLLALLLAVTPALAQTAPGAPNPALRAQFQKYQSVFDLTGTVNLLGQLDADKKTAITGTQAKALLPILQDLAKRSDLKPADAQKILDKLEDGVLTDAQVARLDDLTLQRQEQARARRAQAGNQGAQGGGLRVPGVPGLGRGGGFGGGGNRQGGTAQGGAGGRGGLFAAIQGGQPFNPFTQGREADDLKTLIAALQKKLG